MGLLRYVLLTLAFAGPCYEFEQLKDTPLATATFAKQGVEAINVGAPPHEALDPLIDKLIAQKPGAFSLIPVDGKVTMDPQFKVLEDYINELLAQSQAVLAALNPPVTNKNPKVSLRFNQEGSHPITDYRLHLDAGKATLVTTPIGPPTRLKVGDQWVTSPRRLPVLFANKDAPDLWGIEAAWHQAQNMDDNPRRLFIQIRWE